MAGPNDATGAVSLVSTSADGVAGNRQSLHPVFSPDGQRIAFVSAADNLVPGDTNGVTDVFVKDLTTGEITRISTDAAGLQGDSDSYSPVFSPDGTKIAFLSNAGNLAANDADLLLGAFVKDLVTGEVTMVSSNASGAPVGADNVAPVFSADGAAVSFVTSRVLAPDDLDPNRDLYLKDLSSGIVAHLSAGSDGFGLFDPILSPDGTKYALRSAFALTQEAPQSSVQIYVRDLATGAFTLVSRAADNPDGTPGAIVGRGFGVGEPVFSADGSKVAFWSFAPNLAPGDTNGDEDLFVKDLVTGKVTIVTSAADGTQGRDGGQDDAPVFSPDGTKILFTSFSSVLVPGDTNGTYDVFVKDLVTGEVTRLSTAADGTQARSASLQAAWSPDGSQIAFLSGANNLVPGFTPREGDIFLKQIAAAPPVSAPTLLLPDIATAAGAAPQLTGQTSAGRTVTILDGSTVIGTAVADGNGRFDFTVPTLGAGEHSLTAIIDMADASSPSSAALVFEVGTAATVAANLDAYAATTGLAAIVITDSHVLPFSSKAEVDDALQTDGAALSKIVGGYSFAVTTTTAEATTVSSYDAAGTITKSLTTEADGDRITDTFAAGNLVYKDVYHADTGNHDGHYYAITGKPYATQDAVYDSAFKLISMERHYANGVTSFTQVNNSDGTSEVHNYDTSGREKLSITGVLSAEHDVLEFAYSGAGTTPIRTFQTHYGPSNTKQWTDQTNADGSHVQTSFAAGITLVSNASVADSFIAFKGGADTFVFADGFGADRVSSFAAGAATGHDVLRLDTDLAASFAVVQSMMTKVGNDTLITFDASDSILVKGVAPTALTADNFQFVHQDAILV